MPPKSNANPQALGDYFERVLASGMGFDRFKRMFDQATEKLRATKARLEYLAEAHETVTQENMLVYLKERVAKLKEGQHLLNNTMKLLNEWNDRRANMEKSIRDRRKDLQDILSEAFPHIAATLAKIEASNTMEYIKVLKENDQLREHNNKLKHAVSANLGASDIAQRVESVVGDRARELIEHLEALMGEMKPGPDPEIIQTLERMSTALRLENEDLRAQVIEVQRTVGRRDDRITKQEEEKGVLRQEVQDQKALLDNSETAREKSERMVGRRDNKIERLTGMSEDQQTRLQSQQFRIQEMVEQLETVELKLDTTNNELAGLRGTMRLKDQQMEISTSELRSAKDAVKSKQKDLEAAQKKIVAKDEQILALQQGNQSAGSEQLEAMKKKVMDKDQQILTLQQGRSQDVREFRDVLTANTETLNEYNTLRRNFATVRTQRDQLVAENGQFRDENDTLTRQRDDSNMAVTGKVQQINSIQNVYQKLKTKFDALEEEYDVLEKCYKTLENTSKEDTQGLQECVDAAAEEVEQYQEHIVALEQECDNFEARVAELESQIQSMEKDHQAVVDKLNRDVNDYREDYVEQVIQTSQMEVKFDQAEQEKTALESSWAEKSQQWSVQRDGLDDTITQLRQQLEHLRKASEGWETAFRSSDMEVNRLKPFEKQVIDLTNDVSRLKVFEDQVPGLNAENDRLKKEEVAADTLREEKLAWEQDKIDLDGKITSLSTTHQQNKEKIEELGEEKVTWDAERVELNHQIQTLGGQIQSLNKQIEEMSTSGNLTQEEIGRLRPELENLTTQVGGLRPELETSRSEVTRLTSEVARLEREAQQSTSQVNRLKPEVERLTNQIKKLKGHVAKLSSEVDDLRPEVAKLKPLENQVKGLLRDKAEWQAEERSLNGTITKLKVTEGNYNDLKTKSLNLQVRFDQINDVAKQVPHLEKQKKEIERQVAVEKQTITRLRGEIDGLTKERDAAQRETDNLREDALGHQQQIRNAENESERLQTLNGNLQGQINQLGPQWKGLYEQKQEQEKETMTRSFREELAAVKDKLERELHAVKKELGEKENNYRLLYDMWEGVDRELTEALDCNTEYEEAHKVIPELRNEVSRVEVECRRIEGQKDQFKHQLTHAVNQKQGLESKIRGLEWDKKTLSSDLDEHRQYKEGVRNYDKLLSLLDATNLQTAKDSIRRMQTNFGEHEQERAWIYTLKLALGTQDTTMEESVKAIDTFNTTLRGKDDKIRNVQYDLDRLLNFLQEKDVDSAIRYWRLLSQDVDRLFTVSDTTGADELISKIKKYKETEQSWSRAQDTLARHEGCPDEIGGVKAEMAKVEEERKKLAEEVERLRKEKEGVVSREMYQDLLNKYHEVVRHDPMDIDPPTPRGLNPAAQVFMPNFPVFAGQFQPPPQHYPAAQVFMPNVPGFAGHFQPPPQQYQGPPIIPTVAQRFKFLIGGLLATGPLIDIVDAALLERVNARIAEWEATPNKGVWHVAKGLSAVRCVDTLRNNVSRSRNPIPHTTTDTLACSRCIKAKKPCILVGSRGPVVLPLPAGDRGAARTTSVQYYIRV